MIEMQASLSLSRMESIKLLRVICVDDRDVCEVVLMNEPKFSFVHRSQPNWTCPMIFSNLVQDIEVPNNSNRNRREDDRKSKRNETK